MMPKSTASAISFDRLHNLSSELRVQSPQWADRLEQVTTEQELFDLVCDLFNLSHSLPSGQEPSLKTTTLAGRITRFISENLHHGLTLKVLANFLGYSEKYCSDLFDRIMGESFSSYMRRYRVARASSLLTTTDQTLAEIATAVGFSDQFSFSHFFKRATGHSPIEIRTSHIQRRHRLTGHTLQKSL